MVRPSPNDGWRDAECKKGREAPRHASEKGARPEAGITAHTKGRGSAL